MVIVVKFERCSFNENVTGKARVSEGNLKFFAEISVILLGFS